MPYWASVGKQFERLDVKKRILLKKMKIVTAERWIGQIGFIGEATD